MQVVGGAGNDTFNIRSGLVRLDYRDSPAGVDVDLGAGRARILTIDDTGRRFGPVTLALDANETVHFESRGLGARGAPPRRIRGWGMGNGESPDHPECAAYGGASSRTRRLPRCRRRTIRATASVRSS